MKNLGTYTQMDIFPDIVDARETVSFEKRITGKAIIFDSEHSVALVGGRVHGIYTLPGGGIEAGETVEEGIIRECREETGCVVELVRPVGLIEEYRTRDKKHYVNYCYSARRVGSVRAQSLTEDEKANGMHVVWLPVDEAMQLLEQQVVQLKSGGVALYNTGYNILRDYRFLREYMDGK